MKDQLGRIWLLGLLLLILGLSIWLWMNARGTAPQAQEDYLLHEAAQRLGCQPYLLSKGLEIDLNADGKREYLFSCDSALSASHHKFVLLQIVRKKIQPLLYFEEGQWHVGEGPSVSSGTWLIDRRREALLFLSSDEPESGQYYRLIWDSDRKHIKLVVE